VRSKSKVVATFLVTAVAAASMITIIGSVWQVSNWTAGMVSTEDILSLLPTTAAGALMVAESKSAAISKPNDISILVFTHSHPVGRKLRDKQRTFCRPMYESQGIKHVFAVGRPSYDSRPRDAHVQGQLATKKETNAANQLMEEHEKYGDIFITLNRDHYRDKSEKLLSSLQYAVQQGVDFILKTDDEYCADIEVAKRLISVRQDSQDEIYMGISRFNGHEYEIMKGSDGTIAPFMSGWVFGVSRNLAKSIVDNRLHSMMIASYGTSSDDANLGKWVDWSIRNHNITVDYVVDSSLRINIPEDEMKMMKAPTQFKMK